ncbi:hypothetical protein BSKO_09855 [Bryopsis sp. KO-2023]|nr:hypothetical protein BSKO_09855 [Bryopsis sp. KO-2023]
MPRNRNLRKRVRVEDANESDEEPAAAVSERLKDTRLLQKKRKLYSGVDAALLGSLDKPRDRGLGGGGSSEEEDEEPEILDSYVKAKSLRATGESEHMNRYVENQMIAHLGKNASGVEQEFDSIADAERRDDELYQIPESLKSGGTPNVTIPGLMTGITEVQLPMDVRLKNIEDTEAAKKLLLDAAGGECPPVIEEPEEELPRSFKDTFEPNRSMFAPVFGSQFKKKTTFNCPTDDIVAKKFIKGQRDRWRNRKRRG